MTGSAAVSGAGIDRTAAPTSSRAPTDGAAAAVAAGRAGTAVATSAAAESSERLTAALAEALAAPSAIASHAALAAASFLLPPPPLEQHDEFAGRLFIRFEAHRIVAKNTGIVLSNDPVTDAHQNHS
eukprot:CAMPEP_0170612200 /NCGR_PEP_ID=MMETSP0224-20130122/23597_1 /TAXON_ID=285029 /ORGANISM="Togula jolla, Strain CCCM 725" /LENGTH=126 /DNA_ID=CAMNT_0010937689 /DNA_START=528 /DNA_END=909 /DNA_ORIENTATION=+